ncbi:MAG: hypothetical protein ACI4OZ_01590 [Akkermansia sp.]
MKVLRAVSVILACAAALFAPAEAELPQELGKLVQDKNIRKQGENTYLFCLPGSPVLVHCAGEKLGFILIYEGETDAGKQADEILARLPGKGWKKIKPATGGGAVLYNAAALREVARSTALGRLGAYATARMLLDRDAELLRLTRDRSTWRVKDGDTKLTLSILSTEGGILLVTGRSWSDGSVRSLRGVLPWLPQAKPILSSQEKAKCRELGVNKVFFSAPDSLCIAQVKEGELIMGSESTVSRYVRKGVSAANSVTIFPAALTAFAASAPAAGADDADETEDDADDGDGEEDTDSREEAAEALKAYIKYLKSL